MCARIPARWSLLVLLLAAATAPWAARAQGAPSVTGEEAATGDPRARSDREGCPGCTLVHVAAAAGQVQELTLLLERGADPLAVDRAGNTPLFLAVSNGRLEAVRALLDHGAARSLDARGEDGWTPLTRATFAAPRGAKKAAPEEERRALIALLIDRGADVNAQDGRGNTVLHMAVITMGPEAVQLLLAHGAERRIRNGQGAEPVELARVVGDRRVVKLLE
jgi:ankyrin repeat protein